jgi:autotransporter-associated beta strand protein
MQAAIRCRCLTVEINAVSPPLLTARPQGVVVRAGSGVSQLFTVVSGQPELDDLTLEDGNLTIGSGARLVFDQSVNGTFADTIGGAGSLQKEGAARLFLTGTNTYTGRTFLDAGSLEGDTLSIPGNVEDDALLVFNQRMEEEVWIRPELRARWLHEFGDRERKLEARIGGVPGATYTVRGTELPRDSGVFGTSWTVTAQGRLHFFAECDLAVNSDLLQHSAALGFRVVW